MIECPYCEVPLKIMPLERGTCPECRETYPVPLVRQIAALEASLARAGADSVMLTRYRDLIVEWVKDEYGLDDPFVDCNRCPGSCQCANGR